MTEDDANLVLRHALRHGAMLTRTLPPPDAATVTSYFGGLPRLPSGVRWPKAHGGSANFLAQVDLSALPSGLAGGLLPPAGLLAFFTGTEFDAGGGEFWPSAVIYSEREPDTLPSREPPDDLMPLYCDSAAHYFPWCSGAADAPRVFPMWPMTPVGLPKEAVPDTPDLELWDLSERAGKVLEAAASTLECAPREWPGPPLSADILWMPDVQWPYAWVFVRILAREIARQCEVHRKRATSPRITRGDADLATLWASLDNLHADASSWWERSGRWGLVNGVPDDERARFRDWIRSIIAAPVESKFVGRVFSASWMSMQIAKELSNGTNMILGYASRPDALLPADLIAWARGWHVPVQTQGERTEVMRHQILGPPVSVQTAPARMEQTHVMLAQFASDPGMFWTFGDMGVLQFWITPENLAARRFDLAVMTMEGH